MTGLSAFGSNRGIPHTSGSWEYGRGYLLVSLSVGFVIWLNIAITPITMGSPLRLLPGGAIQFPGGPFLPLWSSAFHGALLTPDYINYDGSGKWKCKSSGILLSRKPVPKTEDEIAALIEGFACGKDAK